MKTLMRMSGEVASLYDRLLAFREDSCLSRNFRESANNLLISVCETIVGIGDAYIIAEFDHKLLRFPEVVSRHSRE